MALDPGSYLRGSLSANEGQLRILEVTSHTHTQSYSRLERRDEEMNRDIARLIRAHLISLHVYSMSSSSSLLR